MKIYSTVVTANFRPADVIDAQHRAWRGLLSRYYHSLEQIQLTSAFDVLYLQLYWGTTHTARGRINSVSYDTAVNAVRAFYIYDSNCSQQLGGTIHVLAWRRKTVQYYAHCAIHSAAALWVVDRGRDCSDSLLSPLGFWLVPSLPPPAIAAARPTDIKFPVPTGQTSQLP